MGNILKRLCSVFQILDSICSELPASLYFFQVPVNFMINLWGLKRLVLKQEIILELFVNDLYIFLQRQII